MICPTFGGALPADQKESSRMYLFRGGFGRCCGSLTKQSTLRSWKNLDIIYNKRNVTIIRPKGYISSIVFSVA